jgi:hypothetical protein
MFDFRSVAAGLYLLTISTPVSAGVVLCDAVPYARLGIDAGGSLLVDFAGSGIVNICNMGTADRGISKEACVSWYSGLLTHRASRTKVRFYFNDANPSNAGLTSCSGLGDWTARAPYFMESY